MASNLRAQRVRVNKNKRFTPFSEIRRHKNFLISVNNFEMLIPQRHAIQVPLDQLRSDKYMGHGAGGQKRSEGDGVF